MHIAINCHALVPPFTGVQRSIREMVYAVVAAAPEVAFSAYVPRGFDAALLPDAPNFTVRRSWALGKNRTLRILWEQFALPSRVWKDDVDVLHAPCYVMPVWCSKPTVLTVHDLFALRLPQLCTRANASHFRRFLPKSVRRARAVVTPTHAVKRELVDALKDLRSDHVRVLPWGVGERFAPVTDSARREAVALKYGLPPRYVLHVGRQEPKKNLVQLVQAYFAATAVARLPHRLVLAGPDGWGGKRLDRMIRELGIGERVVRPGFVDDEDLPAVYSLADALVFPSVAEGFGFPVLEAMACGTPVIASDIPPLREVAGDAARLVRPGDLPAWRTALEETLADADALRRLAEAGRRHARQYTWAAHGTALAELYRTVLAEDQASGGALPDGEPST